MLARMGDLDIKAELAEAKKRKWDDRTLVQRAAELAQDLLPVTQKNLRSDERTLLSALSRMVADEKNRIFVRDLSARVFHAATPDEQTANLRHLITEHGGVPAIFSTLGKLRFKAATMASHSMQGAAIAEVQRVFRSTFGELTLPTQVDKINKRVKECSKDKLQMVLNPLVPEVFGNKSAERYFKNLEAILTKQDGVGLVIQPWRLCPTLAAYSPTESAKKLAEKLRALLKLSIKGSVSRPVIVESGLSPILNIVAEGVKLAMSGTEMYKANVCIEIPAYLKNSPALLRDLTEWAQTRAAKGAQPLKVLLVKGSHLTAEQQLSFLHGDANPVCRNKGETETRYKQLIHTAISAKEKAITPVIGTHNLFDIAYALLDWGRSGREGLPEFCFISGLANHVGRILSKEGAKVLLSTGVTADSGEAGFEAYLLQLVQELARPDGVLTAGYAPESNSMGWGRMRQQFLAALSGREESHTDRHAAPGTFEATPLNKLLNRARMDALHHAAEEENARRVPILPLIVDGQQVETPLTGVSRSLTAPGMEDYRFQLADFNTINKALHTATVATVQMIPTQEELRTHLLQLARLLRKQETELISLLVRDAGFTIEEADWELNNAIDSCRYYEQSVIQPGLQDGTHPTPLGVIVVAPGHAHPLADAISGIASAWVTGNVVIYKPAFHTMLLGHYLTELLRESGFTAPRLQMLPCPDNEIADKLMTDARVNALIFHGSSHRAATFLSALKERPMLGSGTGANTLYLSASCDWQQAIRDICDGVFRRAGQGIDTPNVILLHADIYDNQSFMNALKDAVSAISAAPGWREGARLGPLGCKPDDDQQKLLTTLDDNEVWLVQPHTEEMASIIWNPGVRTGITPASLFCLAAHSIPVIGLLRVKDTAEAIATQNNISAGLAAGIYSLNETEIAQWSKKITAGNIFINSCTMPRPGVLPFGGRSAIAPLENGPNFTAALCTWQEIARPQNRSTQRNMSFTPWEMLSPKPTPDETTRLGAAADSIAYWWEKEFGIEHVLSDSPAETTTLTYRPLRVCLRAEKTMSDVDLSILLMAALKAGCEIRLSTITLRPWMPRALEHLGVEIVVESREEFESHFATMAAAGLHVRDLAATEGTIENAAYYHLHLCTDSALANGRLELLHFMQERVTTRKRNLQV